MQLSTKASYVSVLSACCLLVGPAALYRASYNFAQTLIARPQAERGRTIPEIVERNSHCDNAAGIHAVASHVDKAAGSSIVTSKITPGADGFLDEEHRSATQEIRERLGNENVLFGLKFTLVGAIMWVLFSLFSREIKPKMDFEKFVQKRRVAVFFVAALLSSSIIDTRLRFNAKVIESLGDWVWCIERYRSPGGRLSGDLFPQYWEHFLHLQLAAGSYPILRYFCHFLTALLYAVTLYLFVVVPRTMNRSARTMLTAGGELLFVFLLFVSVSYDPLRFFGRDGNAWGPFRGSLPSIIIALLLAVAGMSHLRRALRLRFDLASAFVQTKGRQKLLGDRIQFACFHHPEALLDEIEEQVEKEPALAEQSLEIINQSKSTSRIGYKKDFGWEITNPIAESPWDQLLILLAQSLKSLKAHQKMDYEAMRRKRKRRQILRNLPQMREQMLGWSENEAELAEERLWEAYFGDYSPVAYAAVEAQARPKLPPVT